MTSTDLNAAEVDAGYAALMEAIRKSGIPAWEANMIPDAAKHAIISDVVAAVDKVRDSWPMPDVPTHIVQKGDTLYSISQKYRVSPESLEKLNDIAAPFTIMVGQVIKLRS